MWEWEEGPDKGEHNTTKTLKEGKDGEDLSQEARVGLSYFIQKTMGSHWRILTSGDSWIRD